MLSLPRSSELNLDWRRLSFSYLYPFSLQLPTPTIPITHHHPSQQAQTIITKPLHQALQIEMSVNSEALPSQIMMQMEAGAFRELCQHLRDRSDRVQNIDLMTLAGFCRNCLAKVSSSCTYHMIHCRQTPI